MSAKTLLLWDAGDEAWLAREQGLPAPNVWVPNRRDTLRTMAMGAAAAYVLGFGSHRKADAFILGLLAGAFKLAAGVFVGKVFEGVVQNVFGNRVNESRVAARPLGPAPSFHDQHSSPYMLVGEQIPSTRTIYGHHFSLNQVPRYDRNQNVPTIKDLNTAEMKRITNEGEVDTYGCVLFPCGERARPTVADKKDFESLCRKEYKVNPEKLELEYSRPFNDGSTQYTGYGVASRAEPSKKDLLITV